MYPVLFSIDGLAIKSYSALLGLGLIAAAAMTLHQARRLHRSASTTIDVLLAAMVGGVIGARVAYVAIRSAYFTDHLDEAWQVWLGGLSWHGGLIGGAMSVWLAARFRLKQAPQQWFDVLAPGAALGTVFGWIACFLSACAYGREVFPGEVLFGMAVDAPDVYGTWAPRLPSQLFGAAWGLIVFAVLCLPSRLDSTPAGTRFALFVALYSAGSWLIGLSRADVTAQLGDWSIEQALDVLLLIAGTAGTLIVSVHKRSADGGLSDKGAKHVN